MNSMTALKRTLLIPSICGLVLAATPPLQAADRMLPGKWEFTMTGDGAPRTFSQCMTQDEANQANGDTKTARAFAEKRNKGKCTIKSYDIQGDTLKYSLACGDRTIDSTTTFHGGNTSEGVLKTTTADGKVDTRTVKARRLGACS